jgi:hypothetical protein
MNPAAHPPAAAFSASSVCLLVFFRALGLETYFTDVRDGGLGEGE